MAIPVCPSEDPKPRHQKRKGPAYLLADWRQQIWEIVPPALPYPEAITVLQLAGVRPSELERGAVSKAVMDGRSAP